jgi:hypothetical protein
MLGNPKNVFWEALLLTIVVFAFGLLLGITLEESRFNTITDYSAKSDISLMDILALNNLVSSGNASCETLTTSNLEFADRIYQEARVLDQYESSGKITNDIKIAHKRYDLMRTLLWINVKETSKKCESDSSSVVYLYQQETQDLVQKATQNVWSKILFDFKQKEGDKIVLIPIAVDGGFVSLNSMIKNYPISSYPVVIINDKVVSNLESVDQLEKYLK